MSITFNSESKVFHLSTQNTSYMILLCQNTYPLHLYWGKRLYDDNCAWALDLPYRRKDVLSGKDPSDPMFSLEYLPFEYPSYGTSDFRPPAYQIEDQNGDSISNAVYTGYEIIPGKPALKGLPAVYCQEESEAETLILHLKDDLIGLKIDLYYTVMESYDVITRHTEFSNCGDQEVSLKAALSVSMDIKHSPQEMLQLAGTALRETHIVRRPIDNGFTGFESARGLSSHQQNPFVALVNRNTDEEVGEAFGISLVYSGNFLVKANRDMYQGVRLQMGINPFGFRWQLAPGESFCTPEAILVYSSKGLNRMSAVFHRVFRERLSRGTFRDTVRPVLLNTWEASYFDFNHDSIMNLAKSAKKIGAEMLVLDDGWFGHRDNSLSSLGDWTENLKKLPKGLKGLAEEINAEGLKMGLWFEPEMVSPDSDLYRAHPDWCIHVNGRKRTEWRNQLVLDLSRKDVCEYIVDSLTKVLSSANIEYVKWDNNRRITEAGSECLSVKNKGELFHRYMLNLYSILETLVSRFPNILFENCASGGARFDPGMMYYFSQTWASDNTDAASRLKIQYGASIVYPPIWITSHVSASPNHQIARETPLEFRGRVSYPFNMGYELNLKILSDSELDAVSQQISEYKEIRPLVQFGNFRRLKSPFDGADTAWMILAPDCSEFIVWYYKPTAEAEESPVNLKLSGISEHEVYRLINTENPIQYHGSALLNIGLPLEWKNGDYFSQMWHFKQV